MQPEHLRILFAVSEAYPFAKVGGLADVGGALPKALARLGHDVRLILPGYACIGPGRPELRLEIPMGPATERVDVCYHGLYEGVAVYTVESPRHFRRGSLYGYEDYDVAPFILFSKAVVRYAAASSWRPDVIHCNDWHIGLAPQYARGGPDRDALEATATVLTGHNLAYRGGLSPTAERLAGGEGDASLLERGIRWADVFNTVSERYLQEVLTPEHGAGLDLVLRSRIGDLYGILNGVDYEEFDPRTDPYLRARYDGDVREGKRANKVALRSRSGLAAAPHMPLIGVVARLVEQKGLHLLCEAMDEIAALGAQVVVMGTGEDRYRRALEEAAARHPGQVAYHPTAEEALARLVYAGADLFLAPSIFEPCGLAPLIALRYGTIPVVRHTGGMAETIPDYTEHPATGLGFAFEERTPGALVGAVSRALAVYQRPDEWRALQLRAMAADYSWEGPSRKYEELYRRAIAKRPRARAAFRDAGSPEAREAHAGRRVPLALVHHANQYLATDGYDNREGVTELVDRYAAALRLHEKYNVPANLHLSGTLVETLAWRHPWFLDMVKDLMAKGLVALVGGTYSENVMPLFGPSFNRRSLEEALRIYHRHLGCEPEELSVCWVPERVWNTPELAPVLSDGGLANGGYRYVLVDDRLVYPLGASYPGSPRAAFDRVGPYGLDAAAAEPAPEIDPAESRAPFRIAGGNGLVAAPMTSDLRYWVPPVYPDHWRRLEETVAALARAGDEPNRLLVYADDMEKTAGIAGWDPDALARYDAFLRWVASQEGIAPVLLPEWLEGHPPAEERALDPGTFFEIARMQGAGEDYSGWWEAPDWLPYKQHLESAQEAVLEAERDGADGRLLELAWKHLLASAYETAWHWLDTHTGEYVPAPWAKALASHARHCRPIVAAARWFARGDRSPSAEVVDVDGDGEDEVVLRDARVYAVIAPAQGGRLVYLFHLAAEGGVLVIGNPTDDWNWQEELNRYMDRPSNHPGALADEGCEHDRYEVADIRAGEGLASVEMRNAQEGSPLFGLSKTLRLHAGTAGLAVTYERVGGLEGLVVQSCLSPDYLQLLCEGRRGLRPYDGDSWRGWRTGDVAAWVGLPGDGDAVWLEQAEAGHGSTVRVEARHGRRLRLLLGCGEATDAGHAPLAHGAAASTHVELVSTGA